MKFYVESGFVWSMIIVLVTLCSRCLLECYKKILTALSCWHVIWMFDCEWIEGSLSLLFVMAEHTLGKEMFSNCLLCLVNSTLWYMCLNCLIIRYTCFSVWLYKLKLDYFFQIQFLMVDFDSYKHGSCYLGIWILLVEWNYSKERVRSIVKHTLHSLGLK